MTRHWLVKYTRRGMEPPRPFGKTKAVVCAESREEAKASIRDASPSYPISASATDQPVGFFGSCRCNKAVQP